MSVTPIVPTPIAAALDPLRTLGHKPTDADPAQWRDYPQAFGFDESHIADLIRVGTEPFLWSDAESVVGIDTDVVDWLDIPEEAEDDERIWATHFHAWRALGQLRAEAAIAPLLDMIGAASNLDSESEVFEDFDIALAPALAMIGAATIAPLGVRMAQDAADTRCRLTWLECLDQVAQVPEHRDAALAVMRDLLVGAKGHDPEFNAFVVAHLTELDDREALPVIEAAFAAGSVRLDIMGDWDDVQVAWGLKEPTAEQLVRKRERDEILRRLLEERDGPVAPPRKKTNNPKAKSKRKQAKASKKKNRKK